MSIPGTNLKNTYSVNLKLPLPTFLKYTLRNQNQPSQKDVNVAVLLSVLQLYLEAQAKKFGPNVLTLENKALQILFVGFCLVVFWFFFLRGAKDLKRYSIQVEMRTLQFSQRKKWRSDYFLKLNEMFSQSFLKKKALFPSLQVALL